jgi:hypothetical protein
VPIEVGIWSLNGAEAKSVISVALADESRLEDILEKDITILGLDNLLIVGRQVITDFGKRIDLLGIDSLGTLHVIELKRDRTPREIVAQLLDYGSWLEDLDAARIAEICEGKHPGETFAEAFQSFFAEEMPELSGAPRIPGSRTPTASS